VKPTLAQKGFLLLAAPLVLLLALVGLVFHLEREAADAQRWAGHSKEVVGEARRVLADLADAQNGVRGFVVTGDPAFLGPFDAARGRWRGDVNRLAALVADSGEQSARVTAIAAKGDAILDEQARVVDLVRAGKAADAAERVRSGAGNRQTDDFRADVLALLDVEYELARARADDVREARTRLSALLAVGAAAGVVCTAGLALTFYRRIGLRFDTLVVNTHRLAAGAELAPPVTGADEIARLDQAFRDMAARLIAASDRLRDTARDVRDLYDNAPCGYHSVDPAGTVVAMNATELRWLGRAADEVIGRVRFVDFVAPASRAAYAATFARVREDGGATDVEIEVARRDGTTFPVLLNSSAIRGPDGQYLRSRTTLTDLTERRRAEDEVRRLNAELEARVRGRTAELEEANRELAQKNAENEMFVYSVSHDLRSPLVNLQGFSRELEKGCKQLAALLADDTVTPAVRDPAVALLDGKMAKAMGFIQSAVLRLSGIIEALLRLSRAGRVEYRWEAVDVGRVVDRVVSSMQGTVAERGAAVAAGALPPAWGDPTAVEQVFANLIGNALAYLDPARPGRVEVGCLPADGAAAGVRTYFVRDNGLGIAEAHRAKIFQVFQRAHPGVGRGEGIGLAIVARIAERHRGRVWVESEAGAGSTFYVTLPAPPGG
jgi:PAS domain S-box-containing protein